MATSILLLKMHKTETGPFCLKMKSNPFNKRIYQFKVLSNTQLFSTSISNFISRSNQLLKRKLLKKNQKHQKLRRKNEVWTQCNLSRFLILLRFRKIASSCNNCCFLYKPKKLMIKFQLLLTYKKLPSFSIRSPNQVRILQKERKQFRQQNT